MIRLEFTDEQISELRHERFQHPHPWVQKKMEALLLKSEDLPHGQICQILGVPANTLRNYLRDFQRGGVDALKRLESGGSVCELDQHTTRFAIIWQKTLLTRSPKPSK